MTQTQSKTAVDLLDEMAKTVEARGLATSPYGIGDTDRVVGESPIALPHALSNAAYGADIEDPENNTDWMMQSIFGGPNTDTETEVIKAFLPILDGPYNDWAAKNDTASALDTIAQVRKQFDGADATTQDV